MLHSASMLFALANGAVCEGPFKCHWCYSPCSDRWLHDDLLPIPFTRTKSTAKNPNGPYICAGCWIYRKKRVTVRTLTQRQLDGKCYSNYSWFMTKSEISVLLDGVDKQSLYPHLLNPPHTFSLSLLSSGKTDNHLQLATINKNGDIHADTPIYFTIDNVTSHYTVYELQEGLKHGTEGKLPGVRLLVDHLGPYYLPTEDKEMEEKRKVGRPKKKEEVDGRLTRKIVK